jgi:amino acid transporter
MGIICCGCCFQNLSAKTNELILIFANFFCLFLFIISFLIIKFGEISFLNLILYIVMLLIIICCLVFTFMLRCWRSSGKIKTTKRETAIKVITAQFSITIINLIVCVIEEVVILVSFAKVLICDDDIIDEPLSGFYRRSLNKKGIEELNELSECQEKRDAKNNEYYIAYVTLSYTELMLVLSLCILTILKRRIINKVDDDLPPVVTGMNPYGRQVIIVHPGNDMGMQNYNYYNNDYNYNNNFNYNSQNMNFGKKKKNQKSNQHINAQNINVVSSKIKNPNVSSSSKDKSYSSSRNFE